MPYFTLLYDLDIKMAGFYSSENAFMAAIRRRHFKTKAAFQEWRFNGSFEVMCDEWV